MHLPLLCVISKGCFGNIVLFSDCFESSVLCFIPFKWKILVVFVGFITFFFEVRFFFEVILCAFPMPFQLMIYEDLTHCN